MTLPRTTLILLMLVASVLFTAGCGGTADDNESAVHEGFVQLTTNPSFSNEHATIDGDHVIWSWTHGDLGGLTLYTISTGTYTEIRSQPFGLSPPKISGDYIVWADREECSSMNQSIGLVLYQISSGNRTCICTNPKSPRFADISGNYVTWQDNRMPADSSGKETDSYYPYDIFLYDIQNKTESRLMPDPSGQEYPSIYGDMVVWSDYRNYRDDGYYKDYFLYSIPNGSVRKINVAPVLHISSAPYIHDTRVLWSEKAVNTPATVHLYNIVTGQEQVLNYYSPGDVDRFSLSGDLAIWTSWEFRGSDIPEQDSHFFDLKTGNETTVCSGSTLPKYNPAVSGNTIVFSGDAFWICSSPDRHDP